MIIYIFPIYGKIKAMFQTTNQIDIFTTLPNNVLLVKIEGPGWYTIYHHLPVVKGVNKPLN
jgi:hypothetical protein